MATFCADIIGGHDVCSMRANFGADDNNVIVASSRQLFFYDTKNCNQIGRATLDPNKLQQNEVIVTYQVINNQIYVFTNFAKIFIWDHETRAWLNELSLPIDQENEKLIACRILTKRHYIFTIYDKKSNSKKILSALSKSERESPKKASLIGTCTSGQLETFDFGCLRSSDPELTQETQCEKDAGYSHYLVYTNANSIRICKLSMNKKQISADYKFAPISRKITCIKTNIKEPMFAVGDDLGRIFLYTGDINGSNPNRIKLHWHSTAVNDICFSSTGQTMFSVGGESGCVAIWDLDQNNLGRNRIIARLGVPIRFINHANLSNQIILSFEDNEIQIMDSSNQTRRLETFTRSTIGMYLRNDQKALRSTEGGLSLKSIGLCWHSKSDTLVTNGKTGWLQFYSPKDSTQSSQLDLLKTSVLSLESGGNVIPSDITRATLSCDGKWLAFFETRRVDNMFPVVRLHIWQLSQSGLNWMWVQTAERLHQSPAIEDLNFSPDGKFLVSVSADGSFHVLHKVCLDTKMDSKKSKFMFATGHTGKVRENLPAKAAFSRDSSLLALSLKNDTTSIWMVVDPYQLNYECQLNHLGDDIPTSSDDITSNSPKLHPVLGLRFGKHKSSEAIAPLAEVRSESIRIWNILDPHESVHYSIKEDLNNNDDQKDSFVAVAFDHAPGPEFFSVCTKKNLLMIFKLEVTRAPSKLCPLIVIDLTLPLASTSAKLRISHMCFMGKPILEIHPQSHQDPNLVKLINRLCLMTDRQELVAITDKLTFEQELAVNGCNSTKTVDTTGLQAYFTDQVSKYQEETTSLEGPTTLSEMSADVTEKQRRLRNRLEVKKMLKDVLMKIPSHNLPSIHILGPMILDKLHLRPQSLEEVKS